MLKTFIKGENNFLKGLKTKYLHFIMMKSTSTERELKEKKKKKVDERKKRPSHMLMLLNKTNDETKSNELVNMINSALKDLKEEIEKMTKKEKEIEDPELIVEIVEKILKINEENQQGRGLKILRPNQMLSRLAITLAQLKAGNNSEKLKNEIRQLLYSLYRSKNMSKKCTII